MNNKKSNRYKNPDKKNTLIFRVVKNIKSKTNSKTENQEKSEENILISKTEKKQLN